MQDKHKAENSPTREKAASVDEDDITALHFRLICGGEVKLETDTKRRLLNVLQSVSVEKAAPTSVHQRWCEKYKDVDSACDCAAPEDGEVLAAFAVFENDEGLSTTEMAVSWFKYIVGSGELKPAHKKKFDAVVSIIRAAGSRGK